MFIFYIKIRIFSILNKIEIKDSDNIRGNIYLPDDIAPVVKRVIHTTLESGQIMMILVRLLSRWLLM